MNNFRRLIDEGITEDSYKKDKTDGFSAIEDTDGKWSVIGNITKFPYKKGLKKEAAQSEANRMNKWK